VVGLVEVVEVDLEEVDDVFEELEAFEEVDDEWELELEGGLDPPDPPVQTAGPGDWYPGKLAGML